MGDEDRRVLIPYSTFHKIYPGAYENNIRFQAYPNMLDQSVDQATELLAPPPKRGLQRQR